MRRLKPAAVACGALAALLAAACPSGVAPAAAASRNVVPVEAVARRDKARVILITLDGARWQDVLDEHGPLKHTLAAARVNGGVVRGSTSSRVPLSLPGYQALAAGRQTACEDNLCPRIAVETLAEGLARQLKLPPEQVATFASWARIARSASSRDGAVLVDVPAEGPHPGVPWPNARLDEETVARAFAHWTTHHPRFLHLALLDMDEWAHLESREGMLHALEAADATVMRVLAEVAKLPEDERRLTTVLVTTDHGRGPGMMWTDHGPFEASRAIFLLAIGDQAPSGLTSFTQADVRPLIERNFGLR